MPVFPTAELQSFWTSWIQLRGSRALPHYRDLFEGLPPTLIPHMVVLENMADDNHLVRFVGTSVVSMWGTDNTNDILAAVVPAAYLDGFSYLIRITLAHPCGALSQINVESAQGISIHLNVIVLPVANDPGRPERTVIFTNPAPHKDDETLMISTVHSESREWLDIGFGTPETSQPALAMAIHPKS